MIVLPLTPEPEKAPATATPSRPAPLQSTLRVLVFGFTPAERELIQGIVALSQRRPQRIELVGTEAAGSADVIMIDGEDAKVMKWVHKTGLPSGKTVIQVDGQQPPAGAIHLQRPIQWPKLPALLQQAQEHDPSNPVSSRLPLSTF